MKKVPKPFPILTIDSFTRSDYIHLGVVYENNKYVNTGVNKKAAVFDLLEPIKHLTITIRWLERLKSDKLEGNLSDSQYSCIVFYKSETHHTWERRLADSLEGIFELINTILIEIYQKLKEAEKIQKELKKYFESMVKERVDK